MDAKSPNGCRTLVGISLSNKLMTKKVKIDKKIESTGVKMAQLRYKIDNDYMFKLMSKIHFHIRAGINLQLLLFSRKSQTID